MFSAYGARRGGELPGGWFVEACGSLGHSVTSIRQTLFRMEHSEELESRAEGRRKFYRLSSLANAEAEAGLRKIFQPEDREWDGLWTLVYTAFSESERIQRDRTRAVLRAEGFATLGHRMYLHPHDRTQRLLEGLGQTNLNARVNIFRGSRAGTETQFAMVKRLWSPLRLQLRYRRFLERYRPVRRSHIEDPKKAFILRLALVFDFLSVAWADPELPEKLLPRPWLGKEARILAAELYERVLPGTLQYGDQCLSRVLHSRAEAATPK